MTTEEKRSVHTDALASLGTIIGENEKRDAIHIAVEPVVAHQRLLPGDHIKIINGKAIRAMPETGSMGIVDPFLPMSKIIEPGERFWFLMYPRQVRSLRHVWSHPDFPDEVGVSPVVEKPEKSKSESEKWLRAFCDTNDCPDYDRVMSAITGSPRDKSEDGDYPYPPDRIDEEYLHFNGRDASGDIPDEFWDHVEVVTGKTFPRAKYFSCSC